MTVHTAAVHYDARFAAEGGPAFTGPAIDPALLASDESATVAILFSQETQQWTVADSQGNVYAESIDPAALIPWMTTYLTALSNATLCDCMAAEHNEPHAMSCSAN